MLRYLSIILLFPAFAFADAPAVKLTCTTQPIGQLNKDGPKFGAMYTRDLKHIVLVRKDGAVVNVLHDGQLVGSYDWIVPDGVTLSNNNSTLTFIAQGGGEMFVVTNGQAGKHYYEIPTPVLMGEDGKHVAYFARQKDGATRAVIDGVEGALYVRTGPLTINNDGSHVVYAALRDKSWVLVDNTKEISLGDAVTDIALPHVSPDGKKLSAIYRANKQQFAWIDGKTFGPFDIIDAISPVYSPDSSHWTMAAKLNGKVQMIKDGAVIDTADMIDAATFSPDSQHLAYLSRDGDTDTIVRDGVKGATYSGTEKLAHFFRFSPDGKRFAYAVAKAQDDWRIVLDGKDQLSWQAVSAPIFSPGSDNLIYVASKSKTEQRVMLQDGFLADDVHKDISKLSLAFSPDGKHVAYFAHDEGNFVTLYVDGVPGPSFDKLATPIVFDDAHTLCFIGGTKDLTINRYTVTISP